MSDRSETMTPVKKFTLKALVGIVALIATVSACSSDKESYQFGHDRVVYMAEGMWKASRDNPQLFPEIKTERDACKVSVKPERGPGLPGLEVLDLDDVIDGCIDALKGK